MTELIKVSDVLPRQQEPEDGDKRVLGSVELTSCEVSSLCPDPTARDIARMLTAAGMADQISVHLHGNLDDLPEPGRVPDVRVRMNFSRLRMVLVEENGEIAGIAFLGKKRD